MNVRERLQKNEMADVAILSHGFADYMRDYEVLVEVGGLGFEERGPGRYKYSFTHCVEAHYLTRVHYEGWRESWEDVFTDYQQWEATGEPDGFVWGARWSMAYPGLSYVEGSDLAGRWSERLVQPMHEVVIETEAFQLELVFHNVVITKLSDQVDIIDKTILPLP